MPGFTNNTPLVTVFLNKIHSANAQQLQMIREHDSDLNRDNLLQLFNSTDATDRALKELSPQLFNFVFSNLLNLTESNRDFVVGLITNHIDKFSYAMFENKQIMGWILLMGRDGITALEKADKLAAEYLRTEFKALSARLNPVVERMHLLQKAKEFLLSPFNIWRFLFVMPDYDPAIHTRETYNDRAAEHTANVIFGFPMFFAIGLAVSVVGLIPAIIALGVQIYQRSIQAQVDEVLNDYSADIRNSMAENLIEFYPSNGELVADFEHGSESNIFAEVNQRIGLHGSIANHSVFAAESPFYGRAIDDEEEYRIAATTSSSSSSKK